MKLNRRGFFATLSGIAAAIGLGPNIAVTPIHAARPTLNQDALDDFERQVLKTMEFNEIMLSNYSKTLKIGDTITVRMPQRWTN